MEDVDSEEEVEEDATLKARDSSLWNFMDLVLRLHG